MTVTPPPDCVEVHIIKNHEGVSKISANNSVRQSNLELLRIVAMFLVLLGHYVPSRTTPSLDSLHSDLLDTIINLELRSISFVSVNCFVLISGYFSIRWRIKSFGNLIFQILFWLIIGVLFSRLLGFEGDGNLFMAGWNYIKVRWFISAYLCLYVVAPMLNAFIENTTKKELGFYMILFYVFSTIYGYIIHADEFNEGMSMISLIGIYLTGAFIKRYKIALTSFKSSQDFGIYLLLGLVLMSLNIVSLNLGINKSLYGYLNPLVILSAVYLFLFFTKINCGHIKIINFIAASAFSVYLFHMHPMIYGKYQLICHDLNEFTTLTIILVPCFFIAIFTFCVIVDRIRISLYKGLYNSLAKLASACNGYS